MKKNKFLVSLAAFSLLFGFMTTACKSGGEPAQQEKISITAEGNKKTLILGETVQLTASVGGVEWSSSKPEFATVNGSGLVTSVKKGSTTIKATKNGYKDGSITITVDYETITVSVAAGGKTDLLIGEKVQLTADKANVTWSSSDETVASVDNNGEVTAKKIGTATISASGNNLNPGSKDINVVRPAPTATLHMEDADHYTADGVWGTSYSGTMYGPGEDSPVYNRSSGNASDGTCIAYMDNGDEEILTFTSSAAVKAELVMMMASRSAVSDMSTVMSVTLNNIPIDLAGKSFAGGGDTNTFVEFSFGELNIQKDTNVLDFNFTGSSPYMDDLNIYAESTVTISVVLPTPKPEITIDQESITVKQDKTVQITSSMDGLTYKSANDAVATVSNTGLVTGVKVGTTTITITKDGYKALRLPVTVTEAEGVIAVSVNAGTTTTGETVTFRTSQNLSSPYNYIVDNWPVGSVVTYTINVEVKATYDIFMIARASGGYDSSATDILQEVMELTINEATIPLNQEITGSFKEYNLGFVNLNLGPGSIVIKAKGTMPTISMFRLVPATV